MKNIIEILIITVSVFLISSFYTLGQNIVINEFMSDNESTIQDKDGDYSDWIELYNNSSNPVSLLNYSLSDNFDDLDKWIFPEVTVSAYGFLLIFASDKDIINPYELHTNFKIKQSGENLFLSNSEGVIISSADSVLLAIDKSFGCIPDGSENYGVFNFPTPSVSNIASNGIYCSHPSGFYDDDFIVSLLPSNDIHKLYYTSNGEVPTSGSLLYSAPILVTNLLSASNNISLVPTTPLDGPYQLYEYIWKEPEDIYKSVVIRFASFDGDSIQSDVFTRTYFIDPDIGSHYTFPIISIVTDSLSLFDYDTGIYIPGKVFDEEGFNWWPTGNYLNRGLEWERDIHITYFENDGTIGFDTKAGMRMRGLGSASYPQKSFGVYFRSEYWLNKIDYPVFEESNTNIYKRLVFRNSGQDFIHSHFKDALLQGLLKSLDLDLQNSRPSVVFINGEYWGIHNIREKFDEYYFEYHFGISEDNLNILNAWGGVEIGSKSDYTELVDFIVENDMSINENFSVVRSEIDIENFIDFQIAEIYYANYDWPCNNYRMWKTNDPDSKWRFLIYDLDLSFAFDNSSSYDTPSMEHATSMEDNWPYCEQSNFLFRKSLENEEFRQQFIDRFAYHMNYTFNPDLVIDSIDKFEIVYNPEFEEHIERWGYPSSISRWHEKVDVFRKFARERPCHMRNNIMSFFNLTEFDFDCPPSGFDEEIKLSIAPNPSNGNFDLINISSNSIYGDVRILDLAGKTVYLGNDLFLEEYGKIHISLSGLSGGIYILNFSNSLFSERKKLLIVK